MEQICYLKDDNCYKKDCINSQRDTKAGHICLEQYKAEMAQAQVFVTKLTLLIYYERFMSISSIISDSSNTSNISQNILCGGEIQ